jgi:hypothetical protein
MVIDWGGIDQVMVIWVVVLYGFISGYKCGRRTCFFIIRVEVIRVQMQSVV